MTPRHRREIYAAISRAGLDPRGISLVPLANGHIALRDPAGRTLATTGSTPSTRQWQYRFTADLRRVARRTEFPLGSPPLAYCSHVNFHVPRSTAFYPLPLARPGVLTLSLSQPSSELTTMQTQPSLPPRPTAALRAVWRKFLTAEYGVPSKAMRGAKMEMYLRAWETLSAGDTTYVEYLATLNRPPHKLNGEDHTAPAPRPRTPRLRVVERSVPLPPTAPPLYSRPLSALSMMTLGGIVQDVVDEVSRRLDNPDAGRKWLRQFFGDETR